MSNLVGGGLFAEMRVHCNCHLTQMDFSAAIPALHNTMVYRVCYCRNTG